MILSIFIISKQNNKIIGVDGNKIIMSIRLVYEKIGIFIKIGMWVTMLGAIGLSSYINYVISFIVYSYIVCI